MLFMVVFVIASV